jgi:serine/threonine protein kinase/Flp pilus assembly protein TadD
MPWSKCPWKLRRLTLAARLEALRPKARNLLHPPPASRGIPASPHMKIAQFEFDPKLDKLGEGPLSEVFRATDTNLGRVVALKILRAHAEIDPSADQRFHREAMHSSKIEHRNIARVYEYGQYEGTSFIAMEFLKGRTLDKIIKDQRLGFEECLRIAQQATRALREVHEAGLIHRDLKPANLMVLDDGTIKLLDFGIARASNESSITQHGMLVGTVLYMSPEQVRGDELEMRSDIFSLGSVIYHMTTGKLPFPGKSFPEVCMSILDGKAEPPSIARAGFPREFEDFINKCMHPDPSHRYADARDAHGALLQVSASLLGTTHRQVNVRGKLVVLPVECRASESGIDNCRVIAGGMRKDLATELDRLKDLEVVLLDSAKLPTNGYDWSLQIGLHVSPPDAQLSLHLARYSSSDGTARLHDEWHDDLQHSDPNEWALQTDLVRNAARTLRRHLSESALKPIGKTRDQEASIVLSRHAHDVLSKGTSKHLMAAISSFRRAIEADPYCAIAYAGLSEATVRKYLYWDGDQTFLEQAREFAARALALKPDCAEAHTSLGFAFHLSGHPTDAQREYRIAIEYDENEWLAHRLLGALVAREGNFQRATGLLRRAIGLKPTHIATYDHFYNVLRRLDRYEEAGEIADQGIAAAKKHLQSEPDDQEARVHLAMLLARMVQNEEALRVIKDALAMSPKDGYVSFHCALVYAYIGETDLALHELVRARDRGYYIASELRNNTDLDPLRGRADFQELIR